MDARKIQFLIGMQRAIDKLEAKEGNTPKVERVKSRFYDVVEVEEVVNSSSQAKLRLSKEIDMSMPEAEGEVAKLGTKIQRRKYTPEEIKEGDLLKLDESITAQTIDTVDYSTEELERPFIRKNREKKKIELGGDDLEIISERSAPHKPKDVAAFLVRFRERKNRGLKYLTHRWSDMKRDQPLTYEEVIDNAKKELQECVDLYVIPEMLKSKVREFVKTKSWSGLNKKNYPVKHPRFFYTVVNNGKVEWIIIDSGWSSDEMVEWVKNNPFSDPNQDDYWKKKLIQPFKRAIEVRDGMFENYMKMNAEAILETDYQRFNPVYGSSLKEARFFTDVPTLFEGIRKLLAAAKDSAKEPALRFEYHIPDSTDLYGIRQIKIITDKNPDIGLSSITKAQLIKGGDLEDAYDHFYGLCNWSILCKRGNEFVKINLLTDINDIPEIELIGEAEVDGFTHILTFYDL